MELDTLYLLDTLLRPSARDSAASLPPARAKLSEVNCHYLFNVTYLRQPGAAPLLKKMRGMLSGPMA
ncbi:hypothetical protein A3D23_06040 [candidate division WOR-1 bacterium RIFCSPHIGHO2_02_FULL_53_26]|nr:MAG: hypothetical protein A3D23_06040 [candidate division WOR-1 bacterium RIFCSPHIGHO2_02_FULL_53_26]